MSNVLPEIVSASAPDRLKVTLRRSGGEIWSASNEPLSKPDPAPNPVSASNLTQIANLPTSSVAENVSAFLSGIKASFRSENVNVSSLSKSKKSSQ